MLQLFTVCFTGFPRSHNDAIKEKPATMKKCMVYKGTENNWKKKKKGKKKRKKTFVETAREALAMNATSQKNM